MKAFLDKLASDSPTPGGGSASAAAGALGAALLSMVFLILKKKTLKDLEGKKESKISKSKYNQRNRDSLSKEEVRRLLVKEFEKSADKTKKVMNELILLIDEDTKSYENVLEKIKKLKEMKRLEIVGSETEIDTSKAIEDLQDAYKHATEVPFKVAKLCYGVLKTSKNLASKVIPSVKSDFQIAISLLMVGIEGAALNVNLNLNEIDDKNFIKEKRKELNKILKYLD